MNFKFSTKTLKGWLLHKFLKVKLILSLKIVNKAVVFETNFYVEIYESKTFQHKIVQYTIV